MFRNEYGMRRSCRAQRRWCFFRLLSTSNVPVGLWSSGGSDGECDWIRRHGWLHRTDSFSLIWRRVCVDLVYVRSGLSRFACRDENRKTKLNKQEWTTFATTDRYTTKRRIEHQRIEQKIMQHNNSQIQEPKSSAEATSNWRLSMTKTKSFHAPTYFPFFSVQTSSIAHYSQLASWLIPVRQRLCSHYDSTVHYTVDVYTTTYNIQVL
jgi:hypothetical protein